MGRSAIVLGAGDGTRLEALTRRAGAIVPKQYCSLDGGPSLLELALTRAERVAPGGVVTVVAARHRLWWSRDLAGRPPRDVIVQPGNRGTAAGVLLPLLELQGRDPDGRVAILPSDHWVDDEGVLAATIERAFAALDEDPSRVLLLGIEPEGAEPGYGWIVPGPARPVASVELHEVETFVEKPEPLVAAELMRRGGLWNGFIVVAALPALFELYALRLPLLLASLVAAVDGPFTPGLAEVYATTEPRDFSRDLLEGAESRLRVLRVPPCGWTDLGTPSRVAECVRRERGSLTAVDPRAADRVNLSIAVARLA